MQVIKKEFHQVTSEFTYEIPDDDIIETFGSLERFQEIVSHMAVGWDADPQGDQPTDEETDAFIDFFANYDYDRYDDWVTDRKGGYDVSYEVGEE